MKFTAFVFVFSLSVVALNADRDLTFLDDHKNEKSVNSKEKDLHRIEINRAEEIRDDDGKSKYNRTIKFPFESTTNKFDSTTMNDPVDSTTKADKFTTVEPEKSSTESVVTTPTTTFKTTTNNVPMDSTTPKTPLTPAKTPKLIPAESNSHFIKWFFGILFLTIFVGVISLYAYKFYQNRQDSAYQNL